MTFFSGVDASAGNTRSHPEHDGQDADGRWYCAGDCTGEQVDARELVIIPSRKAGLL